MTNDQATIAALRQSVAELEELCELQDKVLTAANEERDILLSAMSRDDGGKLHLLEKQCRIMLDMISATQADGSPVFRFEYPDKETALGISVSMAIHEIWTLLGTPASANPSSVFQRVLH